MPVKALIFGGNHGMQQVGRYGLGRHLPTKGFPAPRKNLVIGVQHGHRPARAPVDQGRDRGQLHVEIQNRATQDRATHDRDAPEDGPDDPPKKMQDARHEPALAGSLSAWAALRRRWLGGRLATPAHGGSIAPVCRQRPSFGNGCHRDPLPVLPQRRPFWACFGQPTPS